MTCVWFLPFWIHSILCHFSMGDCCLFIELWAFFYLSLNNNSSLNNGGFTLNAPNWFRFHLYPSSWKIPEDMKYSRFVQARFSVTWRVKSHIASEHPIHCLGCSVESLVWFSWGLAQDNMNDMWLQRTNWEQTGVDIISISPLSLTAALPV